MNAIARVVAAKIEGVDGTPEALTGAEGNFLAYSPKFDFTQNLFARNPVNPSASSFPSVPGSRMATLTFSVEHKGSGAAGTAPALGKLLKACGLDEAVVALTSATYTPAPLSGIPGLTIAVYEDGLRKQLYGARGTAKLAAKSGEVSMWEFTFSGLYSDVADVAILTPSGLEATLPPALLSAAFQLHGTTLPLYGYSIDLGNSVVVRPNANQANGFDPARITKRAIKGSLSVEAQLVAGFDVYGKCKAGTLGALTLTIGASAGNITTVTAPKLQVTKVSEGSADDIDTWDIDFELHRSVLATGNDELSVVLT